MSPKVREPLCEVPSSFTVLGLVFTDHGRGQGRPRVSSQTRWQKEVVFNKRPKSGGVERNGPMVESATGLGLFYSGGGYQLAQCAEVRDSLSPTPAPLEYVLIFLTG